MFVRINYGTWNGIIQRSTNQESIFAFYPIGVEGNYFSIDFFVIEWVIWRSNFVLSNNMILGRWYINKKQANR